MPIVFFMRRIFLKIDFLIKRLTFAGIMRSIFRISVAFSMIVVHLLAGLGFGVHKCKAMGTIDVLILSRASSCAEIHGGCSCGKESCRLSLGVHDKRCCSTEIYHLDSEYSIVDNAFFEWISEGFYSLRYVFWVDYKMTISLSTLALVRKNYFTVRGGPLFRLTKNSLLSTISFWRL